MRRHAGRRHAHGHASKFVQGQPTSAAGGGARRAQRPQRAKRALRRGPWAALGPCAAPPHSAAPRPRSSMAAAAAMTAWPEGHRLRSRSDPWFRRPGLGGDQRWFRQARRGRERVTSARPPAERPARGGRGLPTAGQESAQAGAHVGAGGLPAGGEMASEEETGWRGRRRVRRRRGGEGGGEGEHG